ncbi:MAG: hypothetical protein ACXWFS_03035 [Thermoanaerobaculia bacterium]
MTAPTSARDLLRHSLATLAYRAGKALRDAPPGFETFSVAPGSRTPGQILAHMGDLFDWALHLAKGAQVWHDATQLPGDQEVARFFTALEAFDRHLASGAPLPDGFTEDKLFQGPVADAFTHTGQIGMLRRLAGSPVRGESYFRSDIEIGRVGLDQAAPRREFD